MAILVVVSLWFVLSCVAEIALEIGGAANPVENMQTIQTAILSVILGIGTLFFVGLLVLIMVVFVRTVRKAKIYSLENMYVKLDHDQLEASTSGKAAWRYFFLVICCLLIYIAVNWACAIGQQVVIHQFFVLHYTFSRNVVLNISVIGLLIPFFFILLPWMNYRKIVAEEGQKSFNFYVDEGEDI
jgi:hypothetical protein